MAISPPPAARTISEQHRADALRRVNGGGLRWLWEWAKVFLIAIWLFLFCRSFFVEAFKIPSGSMEHTLLPGDFLFVNKLVYGAEVPFTGKRLPALRTPGRGDVIVFPWPKDPSKTFVKRLVGLPGDTVSMAEGALSVNGRRLAEGYVSHTDPGSDPGSEDFRWQDTFLVRRIEAAHALVPPSRNNWGPIVVPSRSYFVLGDNRDNSLDSRYWGFVPDTSVRGSPMFIYYSYAPDTTEPFAWLTHIRWGRIGERIR